MRDSSKQHPRCNNTKRIQWYENIERAGFIRLCTLITLLLLTVGGSAVCAGPNTQVQAPVSVNTEITPAGPAKAAQVMGNVIRFVVHVVLVIEQPSAETGLHGTVYDLQVDSSSTNVGTTPTGVAKTPQPPDRQEATNVVRYPIEITQSAWQHIIDRHTIGGSKNSGTSIFNQGVDIRALIKNAEIAVPALESNGYLSREFDAGRNIGFDGQSNKQTSIYRVITTQSGKLVTAYPVVR